MKSYAQQLIWHFFFKIIPWQLNSKLLGVLDAAKEWWNDCFITQKIKLCMANEGTINQLMETTKVNKHVSFFG